MSEKNENTMPLDLRLDLLVDAELPEKDRRELLLSLDKQPRKWRDLSIRFLERQVEHRSVRDVVAQSVIQPPAADTKESGRFIFPRLMDGYGRAIAAGLLVAAVSAVITLSIARRTSPTGKSLDPATDTMVNAEIPSEATNFPGALSVHVPMGSIRNVNQSFFPTDNQWASTSQARGAEARRSVVIQPDGSGNAVVIPVKTLPIKFY